jgi:hypothetical protein
MYFAVVEDLTPWPPLLIGEGKFRRTVNCISFFDMDSRWSLPRT